MLKNKLWIVALLMAFAMTFAVIGCTDAGSLDDGSEPKPVEDLVIEGADIKLVACGNNASKVTVDGTKVTFNNATATNDGFYYEFPAAAADYPEVVFYFKVVEIKTGRPGFLIKNTDMTNFVGIANDQDPLYQMNDSDYKFKEDDEFDTATYYKGPDASRTTDTRSLKKAAFKNNRIAFFHQAYNDGRTGTDGSVNQNANWTVEVLKIVFKGGGGEPEGPNEYVGDPTKVVYTSTAGGAIVVDSDPSVTGYNVAINNETGVATFDRKGVLHYKFPTSVTSGTAAVAIDLEADWDYVTVEYTISGIVKGQTGAANADAEAVQTQIMQYDSSTGYTFALTHTGSGNYINNMETTTYPATLSMQTWGAGGKGGFTIRFNDYNLGTLKADGSVDRAGTAADGFSIKINKVSFTKGTRHEVEFFTPQTPNLNNIAAIEVLDGNGIKDRLPAPKNPGWTFVGWFDTWDYDTQNGKGTQYDADKAVTGDLKLFANWVRDIPVAVSSTAAAGATLFEGKYDSNAVKYTYDSKDYWVLAKTPVGNPAAVAPFDDDEAAEYTAILSATTGYTRVAFDIKTLSPYWSAYKTVTVTYDLIVVGGDELTLTARNGTGGGGDGTVGVAGTTNNTTVEAGTDKTVTYNVSQIGSGNLAFVKANTGTDTLLLMRITKVELKP